jgi:hypothetical protein
MSDNAKDSEHQHCWHSTGVMLTSMPPYDVQVCCWCGHKRNVRLSLAPDDPSLHGPYSPYNPHALGQGEHSTPEGAR